MSRTLDFQILGGRTSGALRTSIRESILQVQDEMNQQFTWTEGNLALELHDQTRPVPSRGAAELGRGATTVDDNDWNALLVVRFLAWVSTQLPAAGAHIRVHDEGWYVICGDILIRHGVFEIDERMVARRRRWREQYAPDNLPPLEARVAAAREGCWFVPESMLDYALVPEIMEAGKGLTRLHELTLEDVADRILFPWHLRSPNAA